MNFVSEKSKIGEKVYWVHPRDVLNVGIVVRWENGINLVVETPEGKEITFEY